MSDHEEEMVPRLRWWLSYGGTAAFIVMGSLVVFRGSLKITLLQHSKLMKYWERIFAVLYIICVLCVQLGTFTMRELWDIPHGPDDAWEIIWGCVGLVAAGLCCIAFYSRQCYRIHLHHAFLMHFALCMICLADLIIRDNMSWHVSPMVLLCIYSLWMVAVAPRVFQITGHASVMSNDEEESFVITYGIPRSYQEITLEDLEALRYEAMSFLARCISRCLNCCKRVRKGQ